MLWKRLSFFYAIYNLQRKPTHDSAISLQKRPHFIQSLAFTNRLIHSPPLHSHYSVFEIDRSHIDVSWTIYSHVGVCGDVQHCNTLQATCSAVCNMLQATHDSFDRVVKDREGKVLKMLLVQSWWGFEVSYFLQLGVSKNFEVSWA